MVTRTEFILFGLASVGGIVTLSSCASETGSGSYETTVQNTWRHSKGEAGEKSALFRELVRYATLAPSSHNTQCWKFRIEDASISILPDLSRRCPAVDSDDHHLFISLGCSAENLIQAALANGLMGNATFDAAGGNALRVSLESTRAVTSTLFQAIPAFLGVGQRRPDLVVRFGRGPKLPSSLRRPLEAVLV